MSEQNSLPTQIQALPDGGAELHLVVRMRWEDIATLGREAGRLAVRLQRPVSLDEAAGHKLSGRSAATAHDLGETAPRALPVASPAETAPPQTAAPAAASAPAAPPQPATAPASPVHASTGQLGEAAPDGRGAFDRASRVSAVPSGVPSGVPGGVPTGVPSGVPTLPGGRHAEAPRAAG